MDPYERLAAINEEITRLKRPHRVQKKKQTRRAKEIFKAIDRAANTQEDPKEVEARLAAFYDKQDRSIFGESTEAERIDQAGAKGKKALKDAGLKFKFRQSIGSMNREDNHFIVSPKDVEAAKKALKGVSNAQVKTK